MSSLKTLIDVLSLSKRTASVSLILPCFLLSILLNYSNSYCNSPLSSSSGNPDILSYNIYFNIILITIEERIIKCFNIYFVKIDQSWNSYKSNDFEWALY